MATSEPLVPNDQPYGARKETTAAMDQAGLPRDVPDAGAGVRSFVRGTRPTASSPTRPARPDYDPLLENSPADFPFLAERDEAIPTGEAPIRDNATVFAELAARSGSAFGTALAARLSQRSGR